MTEFSTDAVGYKTVFVSRAHFDNEKGHFDVI